MPVMRTDYSEHNYLVFDLPKRTDKIPLLVTLLWLQIAARNTFKSLTLVYMTVHGSAPGYLNATI